MTDHLARVAAIAEREQAKARDRREAMRAQHPELAAFVDSLRAGCRRFVDAEPIHAVTIGVTRYGREPLLFRRNQQHQPKVPGRD